MAFQFMPGATAVGISYEGGVLLAAEKRVAFGNFVVNKNTKKTFPVTELVGAACAGMIADMQVLVRQVGALAKIRKLETKRNVAPNSVAKLMSVIMFERRFFPLLTQVIVGGVEAKPQIYTLGKSQRACNKSDKIIDTKRFVEWGRYRSINDN
ncbi:MAG: psmB1 [Nitrososphaeraceae archaeon]|nr:psmB1 [Nitrososphaeraceae archaeon]